MIAIFDSLARSRQPAGHLPDKVENFLQDGVLAVLLLKRRRRRLGIPRAWQKSSWCRRVTLPSGVTSRSKCPTTNNGSRFLRSIVCVRFPTERKRQGQHQTCRLVVSLRGILKDESLLPVKPEMPYQLVMQMDCQSVAYPVKAHFSIPWGRCRFPGRERSGPAIPYRSGPSAFHFQYWRRTGNQHCKAQPPPPGSVRPPSASA